MPTRARCSCAGLSGAEEVLVPSRRIPNRPATTTRQVHFEDFEAKEFERLAFAYVAGEREWKTLDWYGQVGGDAGRDIWCPSGKRA